MENSEANSSSKERTQSLNRDSYCQFVSKRGSKWISKRNMIDSVPEYLGDESFEIVEVTDHHSVINRETKSYQLLEFVYHILKESDELQISEKVIKFESRARLTSDTSRVYLSEMNLNDKEDLFTLALQHEMEESPKRIMISYKLDKEIPLKTACNAKSQLIYIQEGLVEQDNILGKLSEILEIDVEQLNEWTQTITRKNDMIRVNIEEVKLCSKEGKKYVQSSVFCKLGVISGMAAKNKYSLDKICDDMKITSEKQWNSQMLWSESFQLPINKGACLCVEVWNICRSQEKTKKKGATQGQSMSISIGQCVIQLDTQSNMTCKSHPLISFSGKDVRGSITLRMEILEKAELKVLGYSEHQNYNLFKSLLLHTISYQISKFIPLSFCCLDPSVEEICKKLGKQMKLSDFQISAAHWSYVSSIKQFMESKREMEYSLILLNSRWEVESIRLEESERDKLLINIKSFYNENLERLKLILFGNPPTNENASSQINELFGILLKLFRFLKGRKIFDDSEKFEFHIESNLKHGINRWYCRTLESVVCCSDFMTYVKSLIIFCQHIINFIRMLRKYYLSQDSIVKVDIPKLAMVAIDPFLAGEIEQFLDQISEKRKKNYQQNEDNDNQLIFTIFALERKIQLLLKEKIHFFNSDLELHLDQHGEWFKGFVNSWLDILKRASVDNVNKVIEVESSINVQTGYEDKNVTSSIIDIAYCLIPNYIFHAKMQECQDSGIRLHISYQVVLLTQETLESYVEQMGLKLSQIISMSQEKEFKMTHEMCQILNNIYFTKEYLEEVPKKLEFERLPVDSNLTALLSEAEESLQKKKSQILTTIILHFTSQFKKYYKVFIKYQSDTPIVDAIAELMDWLLINIQFCSTQLNQEIFNELLQGLWRNIIFTIQKHVEDKQASDEKFDSETESLKILFEFFYNEGDGLQLEMLQEVEYSALDEQLKTLKMNSSELVLECSRIIADKNEGFDSKNGSLTYSIVYHDDSEILEISIMSLKNILNPSLTGKFNPVVKTDILPLSLNIDSGQTKPLKHSKNIFVNEILYLPIPQTKIDNLVVRISLVYIDSIGLRDQGYSGSIYVKGENIGHSSSDLKGFLAQQDTSAVGGLIEQHFTFPNIDDNKYIKILRERTDPLARSYIHELSEARKKLEMRKYPFNINVFPNFFQKNK